MNEIETKKTLDKIFKEVFERENPFSFGETVQKFASDLTLPQEAKCHLTNTPTWVERVGVLKPVGQEAIAKRFGQDEWVREKHTINSIDDLMKFYNEISYYAAERLVNSTETAQSDSIFNSSYVWNSSSIFDSSYIISSIKIFNCQYMFASRDNAYCSLGIRIQESEQCSSSFEVNWSLKISKSMFIHDSADLYECLFCSHLKSKKYCVANMQFEKEEYFRIKRMVVDSVLALQGETLQG